MKYRTIVADPPWPYGRKWNGFSSGKDTLQGGKMAEATSALPYSEMSLADIRVLPVSELAASAAHLYLWTTQKFLWDAHNIIEGWGFSGPLVLVWCKKPMGCGLGDAFTPTSEFVLFAHRGGLRPQERHDSTWFGGPRSLHSTKPDVFLDIVEKVSPGPYLEMFARRARFSWDYWGDESLQTVDLEGAA